MQPDVSHSRMPKVDRTAYISMIVAKTSTGGTVLALFSRHTGYHAKIRHILVQFRQKEDTFLLVADTIIHISVFRKGLWCSPILVIQLGPLRLSRACWKPIY